MKVESLIKYLHDEKVRKFSFKTDFFKNKNTDFASDFDVFSALCKSNLLFVGHSVRTKFFCGLKNCVSEDIDPIFLYSADYRKALWQRVFYDGVNDFSVSSIDNFDIVASDFYIFEKSVDIKDLVNFNRNTLFEALDDALEKIKAENVKMIKFDVRDLKYVRTDDFHAGESYKLLSQGEKGDVFFLWLLCRIFMNLNIKLRLIVDNADSARRISELLSSVKVSPQTYIRFDISKENEYEALVDLVLKNHKKDISLELDIPKEIDKNLFSDALKKLFAVIPLALIKVDYCNADRFCDALESSVADILSLNERELLIDSLRKAR